MQQRPSPIAINLTAFWGKAQPRPDSPSREPYHPLPCHALDVAAVGRIWLETDSSLTARLARLLGLNGGDLSKLLPPLLAVHDIGKFAAAFQIKAPEQFPKAILCSGNPNHLPGRYAHDDGGYAFLCDHLDHLFPNLSGDAVHVVGPLLRAVTGHHGVPPRTLLNGSLPDLFWPEGLAAAADFCCLVRELIGWPTRLPTERLSLRASTVIAGFGIACDWLGSNQRHFPYSDPQADLTTYWRGAREKARSALGEAGLIAARPAVQPVTLPDLLDQPTAKASPMQHWAMTTSLPDGPLLILLEDETGSGKTESALILASRLMARGDAGGIYTALPTMATANALFERLSRCYRTLFASADRPSLALVHGRSHLHDNFRPLDVAEATREERYGEETSATSDCRAWLMDDRRKAFLAEIGVGTIDQAILSILPVRFQALRIFGLAGRVLILDEVHAYDAFVSQELERLIEWQVSQGGTCILLSATLPDLIRSRLITGFGRGLRKTYPSPATRSYPLATIACSTGVKVTPVIGRQDRSRNLPVRLLSEPEAALQAVVRASEAGQAVAYIRNTVDDAIEAHAKLSESGLDARLFHARMALVDRFAIEREVLLNFGKTSKAERRAGRILIATQVIEQSLDIDFDALVTDLAPIDLIIQRAGRLWRHLWRERTGTPELLVVSPDPIAAANRTWFARSFPRAQWVYRDHGSLWLTAESLKRVGAISTPGGIRELIEAVYGEATYERIPPALQASRDEAVGRNAAQRGDANWRVLDPASGYTRVGPWENDIPPQTRLQDVARTTLRLAVLDEDGRLSPYAEGRARSPAAAWMLSEVQVSSRRAATEAIPQQLEARARDIKAQWGRFDTSKLLVVLTRPTGDSAFEGMVCDAAGQLQRVVYLPRQGLTLASLQQSTAV